MNPVLVLTAGREGEEETGGHRLRQRDRGHQEVRPSRPPPNLYLPVERLERGDIHLTFSSVNQTPMHPRCSPVDPNSFTILHLRRRTL